jgi:hypothetical protein
MLARTLLAVVLIVGTCASIAPAQAMQQEETRTSSRYSARSTRGLVKLGIFGVVALVGVGGWVAKKIKGG